MGARNWAYTVVLALALAFTAPGGGALAQQLAGHAQLVADRLTVPDRHRLIAEGNVEVFYEGARLRANRITYDSRTDRITIDGPILLTQGDGFVLEAEHSEISTDLREGLLRSARVVLDRQLQIAAAELVRGEGRYTQATSAIASSCEVCFDRPVPLWEIRAARIVHDQETRQIHFEQAQFRVMGTPVAYLPYLRMPDPTLTRATGFLAPTLRFNDTMGAGILIPYFIAIGPDRDLTITPYLATSHTVTLNLRYRQAFRSGRLEFGGAVSQDSLQPGVLRYYGYATGSFSLARGYRLQFDATIPGDDSYLSDYHEDAPDLLTSHVTLSRTRRDEDFRIQVLGFRSLRAGAINAQLPSQVAGARWERRLDMPVIGGVATMGLEAHGHRRPSNLIGDDGRDMARLTALAQWRGDWVLPGGIVTALTGQVVAEHYRIWDDPAAGQVNRITPAGALELRWPWSRSERGGASQTIEPVAQVIWGRDATVAIPNDDSRIVEFDEGNLFSLNRFPGADVREAGLRANIGLGWTRHDPAGWSANATIGRVFRQADLGQFSTVSPLAGLRSHWLASVRFETDGGLTLANRALFDDNLAVARNELLLGWKYGRFDLHTSYLHLAADPVEGRTVAVGEWSVQSRVALNENWSGRSNWRYDLTTGRLARAEIGLGYQNECVSVDLSLSRRFASSTSVNPTTEFGLKVDLIGFGSGQTPGPRRSCAM